MTPRQQPEPRLELIEMCWRMRSQQKATRILECGIYRTDVGLEVRASYAPDDLLYSMRVSDDLQGRTLAESLRQATTPGLRYHHRRLPESERSAQ